MMIETLILYFVGFWSYVLFGVIAADIVYDNGDSKAKKVFLSLFWPIFTIAVPFIVFYKLMKDDR